jgi:hypothetical protein
MDLNSLKVFDGGTTALSTVKDRAPWLAPAAVTAVSENARTTRSAFGLGRDLRIVGPYTSILSYTIGLYAMASGLYVSLKSRFKKEANPIICTS